MAKRREFPKAVMVEIYKRATRDGQTYCEECGVATRHWHIDHIIPDGLVVDKSATLTAAEGQLLCAGYRETCHGRKTAEKDVPAIAKAKRVEAKHAGIKGSQTALAGRDRATRKAAEAERRADRRGDRMDLPPRRMLPGFVSASKG